MDQRVCGRCGESFRTAGVGRPARYCSRNCRQRAYETNRALTELGLDQSAAPDNVSDETPIVTDETRSGAVTSTGASPSAEFLAEVGMTAEQWDTWRRQELSRPPLVVPADAATAEELAAWRRDALARPLTLPFGEDD